MNKFLAAYVAVALVVVALDALWLGVMAKATYQQAIGPLMAEQPRGTRRVRRRAGAAAAA